MNVLKCEPDPDGESFLTSDNENQPVDIKEDKDPLLKFPVTDSGNELNIDTIKVECETHLLPHTVDTLNEGDVAGNKHDLSLSPVCPLIKCETEVITDFVKSEPNSYCEIHVSPSHSENEMTDAKEEEDPLLLTSPLMQNENEVLIKHPGKDGEGLNWSHRNPQSEHQLKSDYASPVQLNEYQNQVILRRARNAERKRRSRQARKAKETLEEAALRRAQHAEQVRRWRQSRLANETPQVAASRRAQHAEVMRQWRHSQRSSETPEEAAFRRAQQTAQVLIMNPGNCGEKPNQSQLYPQGGRPLRDDDTAQVQRSKSQTEDSLKRAQNAERMRRWRLSRQESETLQEAVSRRAQHAEEVRKWRRSRQGNGRPQGSASRCAQQTAQVLVVNPGNNGENLSRGQLNPRSESQQRSDVTSLVQLCRAQNQDSVRRARNAERKRRWRQSRQAVETPEEAASRRAQHAEEVRRWRRSRRTNERSGGAASRVAQQTEQLVRPRAVRLPFMSSKETFFENQVVVHGHSL